MENMLYLLNMSISGVKNIKEEIPINPTTGLPAKEDDSWITEDGTIYMLISSC